MKTIWNRVHEKAPLVHAITNYVTINDCANMVLASGASPIMAEAPEEVVEICSRSHGLLLNLGMLRSDKLEAMILAGHAANKRGIPVVFDPVGVGASAFRMNSARQLLHEVSCSVIRGNASEILSLCQVGSSQGVDAAKADALTQDTLVQNASYARDLARRTHSIIAMTGEIDLVTDGHIVYQNHHGCSMLSRLTGSGCMLSALVTAAVAANPEDPLLATLTAVTAMGLCGEIAAHRMREQDGNGSFRTYLLDAVFCLTGEKLEEQAHYEIW